MLEQSKNDVAVSEHLAKDGNTVMVDHDSNIGTLWLTIAPNCDWVNARSTSKGIILTSGQSEEGSQTGTTSQLTVEKKTPVLWNSVHQDLKDTPCGKKLQRVRQGLKRKRSFYEKNQETGSLIEEVLTTLWTRCSQCKRMHRYTYLDVLPNSVCQMNLKNGN